MITSFEYPGYFWLPGAEDKIIAGILRYHPSTGIQLETIGNAWTPNLSPRADWSFQPYTICGRCKLDDAHNTDVTLQDTRLVSQSYPEANLVFEAKYLFKGEIEVERGAGHREAQCASGRPSKLCHRRCSHVGFKMWTMP
ncbi:MAG: hypothetical protein MUF38_07190, partial [Anaerolineae bacterium]|nr:hypothetical protein [Anaerolineae bacterium]